MNTSATGGKSSSLLKLLPLNFLILNIILAISALIAAHLSWTLAVVIAVLLGLVVITISFLYREFSFSWTALIAIVAGLLCGMSISNYYDVKDRPIAREITLAEAVDHPAAGGYTFIEGNVRTDLMGTFAKRSDASSRSRTVTFYYAAPVVTENWTPDQPVTVWVVQQSSYKNAHWEQPYRAGIRADANYIDELGTAVRDAMNTHGLSSHPKAVLIHWAKSPEEAIGSYLVEFKATALTFNIVWLVGFLVIWFILFLRRKKKKPAELTASDPKPQKQPEPISTANLLRFLFVVYCAIAMVFALFFSGIEFSTLIPITLLVIGIVFFIISSVALLNAHKKEDRPLNDLLFVMIYPFLVYFLVFFSFDIQSKLFWMFPGYFYFLILTGGFILGILFSPIIALGFSEGLGWIKKMGAKKSAGILLSGGFIAMVWFFTRFLAGFSKLTPLQTAIFWFFLLVGIFGVIKFSYRHSSFNLSKDSELRRKYKK